MPTVEDEGASLLHLRLQAKSRQVAARIRHGKAFISGGALHRARPVAGEIVVQAVTGVSRRKLGLGAVVIRGGIGPPLFSFRLFGDLKPNFVPGIVVLDVGRDSTELLEARQ